ncbi:uncharacterized protein BXZ73DRAFT_105244 [Epithele typhae]|uniref:uncharacterized protein n=1 Tax=Epithele typhae TaxID=378194 RepID=UPI00200844A6|nr:uncharacterized protein BXZ73DRAFT_105244 [Epithele typhae]KAH9918363.1 hypothetical protein BXZ73DRAFT_105244 [Epithele typhae]
MVKAYLKARSSSRPRTQNHRWEPSKLELATSLAEQQVANLKPDPPAYRWHGNIASCAGRLYQIEHCRRLSRVLPSAGVLPVVALDGATVFMASGEIEMGKHAGIFVLTPFDLKAIPLHRVFHLFAQSGTEGPFQYKGLFKAKRTGEPLKRKAFLALPDAIQKRAVGIMHVDRRSEDAAAKTAYRQWRFGPTVPIGELVLLEFCGAPRDHLAFKDTLRGHLASAQRMLQPNPR